MSSITKKALSILMGLLLVLQMFPAQAATCPSCGGSHYQTGYETWLERPTCYSTGMKECGFCPDCYYYDIREVPTTEHQWAEWHYTDYGPTVSDGPTCTEGGMQVSYCTVCQTGAERFGPPLGHDWGNWWTEYEGTCLKPGMMGHHCYRCGIDAYRYTDYGDHVWGDWQVVKIPTALEKGLEERRCHVCDKLEQRELDMLDYEGALLLELLSAPAAIACKAGNKATLVYRITNTGNTTLTVNSYLLKDGADESMTAASLSDNSGIRWSTFMPGESFEITLITKLTEKDIATGHLIRTFTEIGYIWFGENGIPMDWEGGKSEYRPNYDQPILSNDVTVTIPVTELDYEGALLLELLSAPAAIACKAGNKATLVYRVTNTGNTTLSVNSYWLKDGADRSITDASYSENSGIRWSDFVPGDSFEVTLTTMLTENDIAAGHLIRTFTELGYIWFGENGIPMDWEGSRGEYNTDHNQQIQSNAVTVTVPVIEPDYEGAVLLELVSAPASITGKAGDEVDLVYRITNTGNTTVNVNYYTIQDGSDQYLSGVTLHDYSPPILSSFAPGDSFEVTMTTQLTESDIAAGQMIRKLIAYSFNWICENGIPKGWEEAEGDSSTDREHPVLSNPVTTTIPLTPAVPQDGAFLQLEVLSAPAAFEGAAGDEIEVSYRLTNLSNVTVWWPYYMYNDANGVEYSFIRTLSNDAQVLGPGESCDITVRSIVRQEDIDAGQVYIQSGYQGYGLSRLPGAATNGETNYYDLIDNTTDQWVASNTVTVIVPIGDAPAPWWVNDIYFKKYIVGSEKTYATHPAHIGDTIEYTLDVTNGTDLPMCDVEVVDPLKGGNEDAVLTMGDTIEAHESAVYTFLYPVTEDDVLAGEIVNTGILRWRFEGEETTNELKTNTVIVFTEGDLPSDGALTVEKTLLNQPANGLYFTEGETAMFLITLRSEVGTDVYSTLLIDRVEFAGKRSETNLSFFEIFAAGTERTFTFPYTITAEDVAQGFIENTAYATYYHREGEKQIAISETVTVPCSEAFYDRDQYPIQLVKSILSSPSNGQYYRAGETIRYEIAVTNTGADIAGPLTVNDCLLNSFNNYYQQVVELGTLTELKAGETRAFYFDHTVTEEDAEAGIIRNIATLSTDTEEEAAASDIVETKTGTAPLSMPLALSKVVVGAPANGAFYTPGETVHYEIYLYSAPMELRDVIVRDALLPTPVAMSSTLTCTGSPLRWAFDYTVTEPDAAAGSITNVASIEANDPYGNYLSGFASVTVTTGFAADTDILPRMTIVKTETSTPADGVAYAEGEVITYDIHIRNDSAWDFGECIIYDVLAIHEISSVEHLYVGEERHFPFSHTVTAADVVNGEVKNVAWVSYNVNDITCAEQSNEVISKTKAEGRVPFVPVPGTLLPPILLSEDVPCSHTLIAKGENGLEIKTHLCDSHANTQKKIDTLIEQADTDEALLAAYTEAKALWQDEINDLYAAFINASDANARINIMDERIRFFAAVGCHEALLAKFYPQSPATVARAITDMLMDKSVELCYAIHTAPEARVDAFAQVDGYRLNLACGENCEKHTEKTENGDVIVTLQFCAQHATVLKILSRMADGNGSSAYTWTTIGKMWEIERTAATNRLYAEADEKIQTALLADQQAFHNHQAAYEKVLLALYEKPEIVKEVLAQSAMAHVMDLCGLK